MAQRNAIFKEIYATLRNEVEPEEARKLAQRSISENRADRKSHKKKGPGGQSGKTKPVTVLDDACLGIEPECDEKTMFRTISGQCNNLKSPFLGSMSTAFSREIAVEEYNPKVDFTVYLDLVKSRQGGKGGKDGGSDGGSNGGSGTCPKQGNSLPSPRAVSQVFHTDNDVPAEVTHLLTQWGQFLDHDITLTPENEEHDCCHATFNATDECYPIYISTTDAFYSANAVECLEFSRSVAYCEENGGARQQLNGITSFVDASNVYGSDDDTALALRSLVDGKLLIGDNNLLPILDGVETAGDVRALEMPGLAAMHTLWVREHNRVADLVKASDSSLSDEEIYQHARRIVTAEYQSVVYGQYLPAVLGSDNMDGLELNADGSSYDDTVDPSMTNEFATASYRFGHSMIQGLIKMFALDNSGQTDEYPLSENYFNLERYYYNNGEGMEQILMGLVSQPAQAADKEVTDQVTDFLFPEAGASFGQDLVARNIQRGRDHGIPGFCCYLQLWDDSSVNCNDDWNKKYNDISDDAWTALQSVYEKPSDIDLFTGGMAQAAFNGGVTGKVFNKQKADQFKRVKDGDRFFFTHQGQTSSFTKDGRRTLVSRTLAGVICDNTNISATPSNVFLVTDPSNFVDCSKAPSLGDISELMRCGGSGCN